MQCPECEAEIAESSHFCPQCGANLSGAAMAPSAATRQQHGTSERGGKLRRGRATDIPEQEVWQGTYSPLAMLGTWFGVLVLTVGSGIAAAVLALPGQYWGLLVVGWIVLWIVPALVLLYRRLAIRYRLTTQRLFHEHGILRRVTDRIEVIDMHDITFEQGIVERLLGIGTIRIKSNDKTDPDFWLRGIDHVGDVAQELDRVRRAEQIRRGLYLEQM
ncbi:MAG: PH domain-containing protein [Pirellulales bacterium]|nr:PH domain-containing protein [Pirellulales bacterium]